MNSDFLDPYFEDHQSSSDVAPQIDWTGEAEWAAVSENFSTNDFPLYKNKADHAALILEALPGLDQRVLDAEAEYRTMQFKESSTQFHNLWKMGIAATPAGQALPTSLKIIGTRFIDAALLSADWDLGQVQEVVFMLAKNEVEPYNELHISGIDLNMEFAEAFPQGKGSRDWMRTVDVAKLALVTTDWFDDSGYEYRFHRLIVNACKQHPDKFTSFQINSFIKYNLNRYVQSGYDKYLKLIYESSEMQLKAALVKSKNARDLSRGTGI